MIIIIKDESFPLLEYLIVFKQIATAHTRHMTAGSRIEFFQNSVSDYVEISRLQ